MPKVDVFNVQGERTGELELSEEVFGAPIREDLLFDVSQELLAARRHGTASTRTRGEVRGGGRKPWRQKGTGRARHGTSRSPIWVGGGTVFGPKPRSYRYHLPKKVRRAALRSALSSKVSENNMTVLEELSMAQPKTREIVGIMKSLNLDGKVLLVTAREDANIYKSSRNIQGLKAVIAGQLNVLDLLSYERVIMTKDAVARVEEVFAS